MDFYIDAVEPMVGYIDNLNFLAPCQPLNSWFDEHTLKRLSSKAHYEIILDELIVDLVTIRHRIDLVLFYYSSKVVGSLVPK